MTFIDLKLAFSEIVGVSSVSRQAQTLFAFAQDSLEKDFLIPAMEQTASGYVLQDVNVIPIPVGYLQKVFLQLVDPSQPTPTVRMLQPYMEKTFAEWNVMKGASLTWAANAVMPLGQLIIPVAGATLGLAYQVTTAGTTLTVEPAWPTTLGGTVTDTGRVVYTAVNTLESGWSCGYDRIGMNWIMDRPAAGKYIYNLRYYGQLAKLAVDGDSNWWSLNQPELFLAGALVKSTKYLPDDPRVATWKAEYDVLHAEFKTSYAAEKYSGQKRRVSESVYHV